MKRLGRANVTPTRPGRKARIDASRLTEHVAAAGCAAKLGPGDLAVDVGVVHDRREEVDRLHQRGPSLPPVHTRIVRGPEVDQDTVIDLRGDVTQHLSELASGEFARSTGAGDHLRQTRGHSSSSFQ